MPVNWYFVSLLWLISYTTADIRTDAPIKVNKCCEPYEIFVGKSCVHINNVNETAWSPIFTAPDGTMNHQVSYVLVTGLPDCGKMQPWPIYHYPNSTDVLHVLTNGVLRHYLYQPLPSEDEHEDERNKNRLFFDYVPGKYCIDKRIDDLLTSQYAIVCTPEQENIWTSTKFVMRNIVNPIMHGFSLACLLIVAVVYFVMPTLRDLVGNIVTTISMCLIVSQAADLARLLTVFSNHISFIITETICYISLLGAFFWLNSLAYYIWKTFKSRNVYLRITDGKKYCYYSIYAWSGTLVMGIMAIAAHFTLDYPKLDKNNKYDQEQEVIGSLGMTIFFVPVAFTVIMNVFFFATTLKIINRMNTYGRIHHKLKHSFRMFLLLFLVMTLTWLFFLLSFSKFDGLIYCYIVLSGLQGPLILYICIFNQQHVSYLLRKTCCYMDCACPCCRPDLERDWGDEMTAMNTGIY